MLALPVDFDLCNLFWLLSEVVLAAVLQAMLSGQAVTSSVSPPDLQAQQISLLPPVLWDEVPAGSSFGEVVVQPLSTYLPGQAVEAVFRCEPCGGKASSRRPASLGWGP